jgi:hypothetical protein
VEKIYFTVARTKLLQEIENGKKTRFTMNVKTVLGVGYLSIDMFRFWHNTVDCASFGLLPEISLVMGLLAPFWLLAS